MWIPDCALRHQKFVVVVEARFLRLEVAAVAAASEDGEGGGCIGLGLMISAKVAFDLSAVSWIRNLALIRGVGVCIGFVEYFANVFCPMLF